MTKDHELRCAGRVVARYVWDPQLPATVSPRPYLHPVTTLGGTTVTGFMPADHVHHLGASIAVPIVNEANFWGGNTYVTGRGSVHLNNHGQQTHHRWLHRSADSLEHELHWTGQDGTLLAVERRTLSVQQLTADAWILRVSYMLTSIDGLTINSPATRGRAGAGYGGFFWRAPAGLDHIHAYGLDSNGDVHGSRDPWVVLSGAHPGEAPWTLIFLTPTAAVPAVPGALQPGPVPAFSVPPSSASDPFGLASSGGPFYARRSSVADSDSTRGEGGADPWFVRAADYAGVCSAIAWDRPLVIAPGRTFTRRLSVVIADGPPRDETIRAAQESA
ncbi:MAG TPA: PmoA family protein [Actinoplanes sp.]|nr:PmoA family protein [Actinoplanes sp.]